MEDKLQPAPGQHEEINLIELLKKVLKGWKFILTVCGVSILLGLVIAFSFPKEYKAEVQLAAEMTDASAKNNLGGLAAMAGINLNTSTTGDAFSPDLYPDIVRSTPFLLDLLSVQVEMTGNKEKYSLFEYMLYYQKGVWWKSILKAPFRFLGWARSLLVEDKIKKESLGGESDSKIYLLNKEQTDLLKGLKERISVVVDKKTSVMTISVQMQDPLVAAQLTQMVWENLQEYIISYRTQKARLDFEFTEKVYDEAKLRYFESQKEYAEFEDSNMHINKARYRNELDKLKNEMNLTYNVYNTLAQKLEQDRLRVQEQTPVFAMIEPARVPLKPSAPRKVMILIGFVFLGGILSVGYILFKEPMISILSEVKNK